MTAMTAMTEAMATARDNAATALRAWIDLRRDSTIIDQLEFDRWDDDGDINGVQILHDDDCGVVAFIWVQHPDLPGEPGEGEKVKVGPEELGLPRDVTERLRAAIAAGASQ